MTDRYPSESHDVSPLGRPLTFEFSGRTAKNRFMKAAMTERVCSWDPQNLKARGIPSAELINLYKRWGEGGYGQIVTGNILISYDYLEARGNPIITREDKFFGPRFNAFKDVALAAKANGSLIVGQVNHPGRQVPIEMQEFPLSASDIQLKGNIIGMEFAKPRAATEDEIKGLIDSFAHVAEYLEKAGYDGIQLHAAHGYLLAQFLSLTTNKRTDQYGGSLTNRSRIIIEIAEEIHKRVSPSFILGIKVNSVEFQSEGFTPEEAMELCQALEAARFDYVELSGGTYESLAFHHKRDSTKRREAFFIEFANEIVKPLTKTKSYLTGGFQTVGGMLGALEIVDGIGIARVTCQEPCFANDILQGKITGAIRPKLDMDDIGVWITAVGAQIRQIGKDYEPIDLSDEKNVEEFFLDLEAWSSKLSKDTEMKEFGYMDFSQEPTPYKRSI